MKSILVLLTLFASLPLFALYNGNTSAPDMPELGFNISNDEWWGIKVGYVYDNTIQKRLKHTESRNDFDSCKNLALLTFNVIDRFEFYGAIGTMQANLTTQNSRLDTRVEYETDHNLAWGVGGRVILVYWDEVVMGVNALYNFSRLDIERKILNGTSEKTGHRTMDYDEWQVGVTFSREIGIFTPYTGVAYASMDTQIKKKTFKNRQPFMFVIGVGITSGNVFAVNIESRMVGEKAIALSGDLRF